MRFTVSTLFCPESLWDALPTETQPPFLFHFISGAELDRLSESSDRWIHKDSRSHNPTLPITQRLMPSRAEDDPDETGNKTE